MSCRVLCECMACHPPSSPHTHTLSLSLVFTLSHICTRLCWRRLLCGLQQKWMKLACWCFARPVWRTGTKIVTVGLALRAPQTCRIGFLRASTGRRGRDQSILLTCSCRRHRLWLIGGPHSQTIQTSRHTDRDRQTNKWTIFFFYSARPRFLVGRFPHTQPPQYF